MAVGGAGNTGGDDIGQGIERGQGRSLGAVWCPGQYFADMAVCRVGHILGHLYRIPHAVSVAANLAALDKLGEGSTSSDSSALVDNHFFQYF
ncbi:hypothetical protein [Microbulbifer taiwanensis]|uniref:hypothetical protein n=1 Tax=Microbulbifer taiwanensis TaxID=986746 RepID=UPI0036159D58